MADQRKKGGPISRAEKTSGILSAPDQAGEDNWQEKPEGYTRRGISGEILCETEKGKIKTWDGGGGKHLTGRKRTGVGQTSSTGVEEAVTGGATVWYKSSKKGRTKEGRV